MGTVPALIERSGAPSSCADPSFRHLLGELAWRRLAPAVRARFAVKPAPGAEIQYVGAMRVVRCSRLGWVVARLCRLVGTPIAPHGGTDVPVGVTLRLAADGHGIVWERLYRFPGHAPVRCLSVKRATADGLIECVGRGVGMWLALAVEDGALHFRSTGYFWRCGHMVLRLPLCLTPGAMHVAHTDLGGGRFRFQIDVRHPLFGETFHQDGVFTREGGEPWTACSC
jgi:hypothetical protein